MDATASSRTEGARAPLHAELGTTTGLCPCMTGGASTAGDVAVSSTDDSGGNAGRGGSAGANAMGPGAGICVAVSLQTSGTESDLQTLGREMARVRLMGRPKGTLPVRMRQAQSAPVRTTPATALQHCSVGEPPPLVLPVTKLRHGVNVLISDAVHDVATPACPDTAAGSTASTSTIAAAAPIAPSRVIARSYN